MKRLLVVCAGLISLLALAPVQAAPAEGASTTGVNHVNGSGDDQTRASRSMIMASIPVQEARTPVTSTTKTSPPA